MSRDCWIDGYDINTNYYADAPPGKLVEYDFVVSQQVVSPDGYETIGMVVNGQYPGPAIEADWGDTIRVTVRNNLTNYNGTALHWHGIQLNRKNWMDGVPGVTQCPIKPGGAQTYEFKANQYGTSWYHSHFSLQYSSGLYGPLVIHGPSSRNWDVDLGPWLISDWYHGDIFYRDKVSETTDTLAVPDSSLLNGKGVYNCNPANDTRCTGKSEYYEVVFKQTTSYKIGLVNTGTLLTYTFYIDGHNFAVIEADFVPIEPYVTEVLNVGIGQRYEIVVDANAILTNSSSFWVHAQYCGAPDLLDSRIGIIRYNKSVTGKPEVSISHGDYGCDDPVPHDLRPVVTKDAGRNVNDFNTDEYMYVGHGLFNVTWPDTSGPSWLWEMKAHPLYVNWSDPSVGRIIGLSANTSMPGATTPIYLDYDTGDWVYYVITSNFTAADVSVDANITLPPSVHPMHLHGHDFLL